MPTRRATSRPSVRTYVQWTGANQSEVEEVMGREVEIDGSGAVIIGDFGGPITCPVGDWCSPDDITSATTAQLDVQQEVTGTGPFTYGITSE